MRGHANKLLRGAGAPGDRSTVLLATLGALRTAKLRANILHNVQYTHRDAHGCHSLTADAPPARSHSRPPVGATGLRARACSRDCTYRI
eukprot:6194760-Pleurochrysis_carterae.AAC.1